MVKGHALTGLQLKSDVECGTGSRELAKRVSRPGVREGYDRWAEAYDRTPNPLVALDRRHTIKLLDPRPGERILDAGCGTGVHLRQIRQAKSAAIGVDLSLGMLRIAKRANPGALLVQADLNTGLPLQRASFDAVVCALVSEHLTGLRVFVGEARAVLRQGGRMVFSAFHPEMAASGIEANFLEGEVEYRLGAEHYTVDDYLNTLCEVGFRALRWTEHRGDAELVRQIPWAEKYLGQPLLLLIEAGRPTLGAT